MNLFNFHVPEWFFVAFSLCVLIFLLNKFLWKPINKVLDERRSKIDKSLSDAAEIEAEKQGMVDRRAAIEDEFHKYTAEQMKQARTRAGREYDRITADAEEKAKMIIATAQAQGLREREAILNETKAELVSIILELSGALVAERMDGDLNEHLVRSLIAQKDGKL